MVRWQLLFSPLTMSAYTNYEAYYREDQWSSNTNYDNYDKIFVIFLSLYFVSIDTGNHSNSTFFFIKDNIIGA